MAPTLERSDMLKAILECRKCGRKWTCRAWEEPDVNAFGLNEDDPACQGCPECNSEDYDIRCSEFDYDD